MEREQRTQILIKPKTTQAPATSPDKKQLLLLGLQLLNRSLNPKVPCAVVKPSVQTTTASLPELPGSPAKDSGTEDEEYDNSVVLSPGGSRKRKRLSNNNEVSMVDKREKRKMMNRVAAQNARDRKKAYIEDLEKKIAALEEKNVQLQEENLSLKQHTTNLTTEKQQLEQRLAESAQTDVLRSLIKESLLESPVGSAVPRVSPQQKQLLKALLVRVWMTFSLTFWLASFNKMAPKQQEQLLDQMIDLELSHGNHMTLLPSNNPQLLRLQSWWGASEQKWNPPRI